MADFPFQPLPTALGAVPPAFTSPFGANVSGFSPLDKNYQRNLTTLTNKYSELSPVVAQLPAYIRNALIGYDSSRVAGGSAPMTREQTYLAMQTALTNQQATPEPDRNPLNIFGNIKSDLSTILRSIPRLPFAMVHEVQELPQIPQRIAAAQQAGLNPLSAMLQAPGIRMIPGAYTLGNIASGNVAELTTHPVMTFLDVLPIAHSAASATRIGKLAGDMAVQAGLRPRPISSVLTRTIGPEGELARNLLGRQMDSLRNETRLGQTIDAFGGARARSVARMRGTLEQRYKALFQQVATPEGLVEQFAPRVTNLFERYQNEYPFLSQSRKVAGPEFDAQRRAFYETVQRNPDSLHPGFINELRDMQLDFARYQEAQGNLGMFDNEWFPTKIADRLRKAEGRVEHSDLMMALRNEYMAPTGTLTTDGLTGLMKRVMEIADTKPRANAGRAFEQVLDAHGMDVKKIRSARAAIELRRGTWDDWRRMVESGLSDFTPRPRTSLTEIVSTLRRQGADRQANLLESAVQYGKQSEVTKRLKNLYSRKPPNAFPGDLYPAFRDDTRSMSRRVKFDTEIGRLYTDKRHQVRMNALERMKLRTPPARFGPRLADQVQAQGAARLRSAAEDGIGRTLSAEEAGALVRAVQERRWSALPGVDPADATEMMRVIEREVTQTWRDLRQSGFNPVFVHKVSPQRMRQALEGPVGPVKVEISQAKERALDLSPEVGDLQVSLTHQAGEMLQREYSEKFIEQVIDSVGVKEDVLRERLADEANARVATNPSYDFESSLEELINRQYTKFDPETSGYTWGGRRLDKFRQENYWIPKAVARNLDSYIPKRQSLLHAITDPVTKAFRYNVIGLSPSLIINNFFSNAVAMTAEVGMGPWRYWNVAREWLRNPRNIPNEQLKGMIQAEIPHMEFVSRRFNAGVNSYHAFRDSAAYEALKRGKNALDGVVEKSLHAQRWGDNVYRAMIYMDRVEKGLKRGLTDTQAANAAMETVRRTLVDYASFTPIERSAMRTIIPFYSYMGHAARFIARFPLDHPMRASIASHLAAAERERLGALPGSWLSMIPIGGITAEGAQRMLALRPFDPFGDQADLVSISGWIAASNPVIQTALQQVGVIRGEAEMYPTLRYDPQTGRMRATHGNFLVDLFHNTLPRAALFSSILGLNPQFNEVASRDPDAAKRMLVSMAGLPRAWRQMNVPAEQFKGELSRKQATDEVLNSALKSGDWTEAMRYPSLRPVLSQLQQTLTPQQVAAMQPASESELSSMIQQLVSGGQ